jgi:hypothetical protein
VDLRIQYQRQPSLPFGKFLPADEHRLEIPLASIETTLLLTEEDGVGVEMQPSSSAKEISARGRKRRSGIATKYAQNTTALPSMRNIRNGIQLQVGPEQFEARKSAAVRLLPPATLNILLCSPNLLENIVDDGSSRLVAG